MQLLRPTTAGQVVALHGQAVARAPGGALRLLAVGDWVASDEVIVAAQNGFVQLATDDEPAVRLAAVGAAAALAAARSAAPGGGGLAAPSDLPVAEALRGESASPLAPGLRVAASGDAGGPRDDAIGGAPSAPGAAVAGPSGVGVVFAGDPGVAGLAGVQAIASGRPPGIDRLAPWAVSQRLAGTEDTPLPIALSGRDPDGHIAQVWIVKVPTGGVLYQADGVPIADRTPITPAAAATLSFHPAPDFHGNPGVLQYFVVDGSGKASAVQTVTIDLAAVNDPPRPGTVPLGPDGVAIDDPSPAHVPGTPDYLHRTAVGEPVSGVIAATDVDGDTLSFRTDVAPAHGELRHGADGAFTYTPAAGFQGTDRFVVGVDDGQGGHAQSTVTVAVGVAGAGTASASAASAAAATATDPTATDPAMAVATALELRDLFSAGDWHGVGPGGQAASLPPLAGPRGDPPLDLGLAAEWAWPQPRTAPWTVVVPPDG